MFYIITIVKKIFNSRKILCAVALIYVLVLYALFLIKEQSIIANNQLVNLKREIKFQQDTINLLKAEFSYLSSPQELRKIIKENNINLANITIAQIIKNPILDIESDEISDNKAKNILANNQVNLQKKHIKQIKWRYKKMPQKFLHTISMKKKK